MACTIGVLTALTVLEKQQISKKCLAGSWRTEVPSGRLPPRVGHRETGHHRVTGQGRFWRFSALVGSFELLFA